MGDETFEQLSQRIIDSTIKQTQAYFDNVIISPEWAIINNRVLEGIREELGRVIKETFDALLIKGEG